MLHFFTRIPTAWKTALVVGLGARVGLAVWGLSAFLIGIPPKILDNHRIYYWGIQPITDGFAGAIWGIWQRWDVIHYMRIAQSGYNHEDLSVFLPLFPSLGNLLSRITGVDILASLSLISLGCTIISMALLYKIVHEFINPTLALSSLIFLVFFPSSFFFFVPYPQSMALMLVLLLTWAALRHKWELATAAGFTAGLTHMTLIAVCSTLGYLTISNIWPRITKKFPQLNHPGIHRFLQVAEIPQPASWLSLIAVTTPILGGASFLIWRWWQGFPSLSEFQLYRWERTTQWPWETLVRLPSVFTSPWFGVTGWINLAVFIFSVAVCVWTVRKMPAWMWLFQISGLIVILSTGTIQDPLGGFDRYALFLYPIFIALASWTQGKKRIRIYLLSLFAVLQLYMSFLYIQWVWVG